MSNATEPPTSSLYNPVLQSSSEHNKLQLPKDSFHYMKSIQHFCHPNTNENDEIDECHTIKYWYPSWYRNTNKE